MKRSNWALIWTGGLFCFAAVGFATAWAVGLIGGRDAGLRDTAAASADHHQPEARRPPPPEPPRAKSLHEIRDVLREEMSNGKLMWMLGMQLGHPTFSRQDASSALADLSQPETASGSWEEDRSLLLLKHKPELMELVDALNSLGPSEYVILQHVMDETDAIPLSFAQIDGKYCLVITRVALDEVLNTLKFDAKERAVYMAEGRLLPMLPGMRYALDGLGFPYVAIVIFYGSQNFLDRDEPAKPEALAIVASTKNVLQFVNADISQVDFLRRAQVYLSDRDMNAMKRIELVPPK